MRGGAPSTRAHTPARSSPANPSSIPHFETPCPRTRANLGKRDYEAGHKKNVATGTKCGVLGVASPPPEPADLWRADRRGRSRNRWLIADFQNFKKNLHPQPPPSIIGTSDWPEFGSNALRPVISYSMAC